jgi:hypothetical protein
MRLNGAGALRVAIIVAGLCASDPGLYGGPQPWFEPNSGQAPGPIRFIAHAVGYTAAFDQDGSTTYILKAGSQTPDVVRMELIGSRERPTIAGDGALNSLTRYYRGDLGEAGLEVANYSGITYRAVYPGVNLRWYSRDDHSLEYEFRLKAGVDPGIIRFRFVQNARLAIERNGDLAVTAAKGGILRYRQPQAWQEDKGRRIPIKVRFRVESGAVSFETESIDLSKPLVIDPVLEYSTYLGGSGFDAAYAMAADPAGNLYITGETASLDFPGAGGTGMRSTRAVFVTKLSSDGSRALYTTILASTGNDSGRGIAVDNSGNVWVAGIAGSAAFPTTANALSRNSNGSQDAFVAKLDASGRLVYATYLGGSGTDAAAGIAADATGVYVAGYTGSTNFPVTQGAPQASFQGGFSDAFILKLDLTGTSLLYSTLLGGTGNDSAASIAVDANGNACIAGRTDSPALPLRNALQSSYGGGGDALFGCLNAAGAAWNVLSYFGGSGPDEANAITLDASGNIYLTGDTFSSNFPVSVGAYQTASRGNYDAFAVKLNSAGNSIVFSTLLGGSGSDSGAAIAIGLAGTVWVTGYSGSVDFPATMAPGFGGSFDGFIAGLRSDGGALLMSGYIGGSGDDRCSAMTVSSTGEPIVVGLTGSVDFPATAGVMESAPPAPYNGFVSRVNVPRPSVVSVSPSSGIGLTSKFSFMFSDPNSASDLALIQVLINGIFSGAPACYASIDPALGLLWLFNDGGTALLGPIQLGAAGAVQNGQCTVNGAGSSLLVSGNTLILNVAVSFPSNFTGAKSVYGYAQTAAGVGSGWQTLGTWNVMQQPPQVVSVTPSSGMGNSGTFSFTFSDANGTSDLSLVQVLINGTFSGAPACYASVDSASGLLWLFNDVGTGLLGPVKLGTAGTVRNGQCTVNGVGSSLLANGNALTVNLAVSFPATFTGAKGVYAYAQTIGGLGSGWQTLGTWNVMQQPPQVVSVTRSSGTGSSGTFSFTFSDANGASDLSLVQALINGTFSGAPACYVSVATTSGLLWLFNDGGTALLGPIQLGAAGAVQNGQCTVNGAESTLVVGGNTLTLNLAVSFPPAFVGSKSIYGYAQTIAGQGSGWRTLGTWNVH